MPYRVEFLRSAARELTSLPKSRQKQIARFVDDLVASGTHHGTVKLEGEDKLYRIRAGDYRLIYELNEAEKLITVIKIRHRREAYRDR